jgi:hypothetical protein
MFRLLRKLKALPADAKGLLQAGRLVHRLGRPFERAMEHLAARLVDPPQRGAVAVAELGMTSR